jgi:hypothetical protein
MGGPGPEDTLLYSAPKPPPPPVPNGRRLTRRAWPTPAQAAARSVTADAADVAAHEGPAGGVRDWSSRHDPRSRNFDVSDVLAGRVPLADKLWPIGPVFDQGTTPPLSLHDASGCVGMACRRRRQRAGDRHNHRTQAGNRSGRSAAVPEDALALYARAQQLDQVSGEAYAGTSVLAGMKAGQEAGLVVGVPVGVRHPAAGAGADAGRPGGDRHSVDHGMEDPDPAGVIRPGGNPAGGHSMALVGLVTSKPGGPWFVAQQSRGPKVGDHGRVLIHHKDLARLLAGVGEAAVPVPPGATK